MVLKITGGEYSGRILHSPKGTQTRPSSGRVREALFNRLGQQLHGLTMLDLFAGSGAVGLDALSRGAAHVTFVENHRLALAALQASIAALKIAQENYAVTQQKVERFLNACPNKYDIIFADPPYDLYIDSLPAVVWVANQVLRHGLLKPDGYLILECRTSALPVLPAEWPSPIVKTYGEATLIWIR